MDIWFFYDVTHRLHDFMNPFSEEGFRELDAILDLPRGARIVDAGCGKGEFLRRLVLRTGGSGLGIEASPYTAREARRRAGDLAPGADIAIKERKAEDHVSTLEPESFDAALCVGASWIWNGWRGTLEALRGLAKPGGYVVLGEPYWAREPSPEYLAFMKDQEGVDRETFTSPEALVAGAAGLGMELCWMRGSTRQEWDRYETLQMAALDRFARDEPGHPDLEEIRRRKRKDIEVYLRWGREELGFALWVFRKG